MYLRPREDSAMAKLVVPLRIDLFPYVRTTQRQKWVDPAYQKYSNAKQQIRAATVDAMNRQGIEQFAREPLRLALFINVPKAMHRRDLSNILKGVEDGAQHAAYKNDAWIDQIVTTRYQVEGKEARAVMIVQPVSDGPYMFSNWVDEAIDTALDWGITT
jgi:Holliday junction resolvase RusA-like endonuclease